MSKRILALLLAVLMLTVAVAGCRGGETPATTEEPAETEEPATEGEEAPAGDGNYRIGIITGTVSQGEEEFQAAEKMKQVYGEDRIITATYPDNFTSETETVISNTVEMASHEDVVAIVFLQAVPGASAAIDKVRETRPDMLFIAGVPGENPADIAAKADIVLNADDLAMGPAIAKQAAEQGAKTLIHYSFPRHMSYPNIAARHELMKAEAEALGIEFVDVTAPDPTGDSGVAGAQQFIIEDVPRQIEKYGKDTAFFSTNCGMQEPLIRSILEQGAIFPQQCCPSPYHGYPAALGIDVAGHEGDIDYIVNEITKKVEEGGNAGRMSTWPAPINMIMVEAGTRYAIEYAEGRTDGRVDAEVLQQTIEAVATDYGAEIVLDKYVDEGTVLENFYLLSSSYVNFGVLDGADAAADTADAEVSEEAEEATEEVAEEVVEEQTEETAGEGEESEEAVA